MPDGVLSQKKMQLILWDVVRADEMVAYTLLTDSSFNKPSRTAELYAGIFKIHGITKESFEKSIRFYQLRPDLLQPVLDSLKNFSERNSVLPQGLQ